MDPTFLITIILTGIPLLILVFFLSFSRKPVKRNYPELPPGKTGLPYFGESIEFVLGMWRGDPEKFVHKRVSHYLSKTFRTWLLGDPVVLMYGSTGNKFLFQSETKLVKLWWPKPVHTLIPSSNAEAFRVRDVAHPYFKPDVLRNHVGAMDLMAKRHLDAKWEGRQEVVVCQLVEDYAFSLACQLFLSVNDEETIQTLANPMAALRQGVLSLPVNLPWTQFGRAVQASKLIMERLGFIIRKRIEDPQRRDINDDLLSYMLSSTDEDGKRMTVEEIADRAMGLLVAGHDTSTVVIAFVINYLADHPDIYHKVLQEQLAVAKSKEPGELLNWEDTMKMKYSWNVACEVMRIYPPAIAVHREAINDFTYDGYRIPKGYKIQINIFATHRDPEYFPNPEKFDPSRFEGSGPAPYTYVPFGGGPRMCPGKNYAKLEILVFIHNLMTRFRWEKIHANEAITLNPLPKPVHGLPIRLHRLETV